jgi:hypothetical protein
VKTKKENKEKKKSRKTESLSHCGDFRKTAEMMKNYCPDEGNTTCCCPMMGKVMSHGKGAEAKETKETQNPPKGGENG